MRCSISFTPQVGGSGVRVWALCLVGGGRRGDPSSFHLYRVLAVCSLHACMCAYVSPLPINKSKKKKKMGVKSLVF
jgi:hypothetical protein